MTESLVSPVLEVLACQIAIPHVVTAEGRDTHLRNAVEKVRRRLSIQRSDLVALPELSSIDYSPQSFERIDGLAEPLDGPSFQAWHEVAREFDTHVAYSFPRRAEAGVYISLAVIGPSGTLMGHYDKIHLVNFDGGAEKKYFVAGDHLFVFQVKGFRIAPIICYDIRIPELTRRLVVEYGVDMILHSSAYERDRSFHSWHQLAYSRAIENQVYFLSLNRAGEFFGKSIFCWPWMDEERVPKVFSEHDEVLEEISIERMEITLARERFPYLNDRRESYDLPVIEAPGV